MTKRDEYRQLAKFIWCWLFHKDHRARTGKRRIGQASISYEILCSKCGNTDTELVLFLSD